MTSELITLLSEVDQLTISNHIKDNGFDSISDIVSLISKNSIFNNDYTLIDADILIMIDLRINYKIFIIEDEIFTREQVIDKFNLIKFKIQPEQLFNNQRIELIGDDYFIYDELCETKLAKKLYNTKIYIGKERWKDFMITFRFMRSLTFISETRLSITDSEKNNDLEYIDKVIEQVLNNET